MKRGCRRGIAAAAAAALIALVAPGVASAQVQTVTANVFTDDTPPGNIQPTDCTPAHCTLREALEPFPSRIVQLLPGTYEVSQGAPLSVNGVKTINGAGATIDATGQSGVVKIEEGATAVINDVTITGGIASGQVFGEGGGINVVGSSSLQLNRSAVVGNLAPQTGGGISNPSNSDVDITDSTISGNGIIAANGGVGGGIYTGNGSTTRLFNTTVSGNQLPGQRTEGAGIFAQGALEMTHVTIAGNIAVGSSLRVFSAAPAPVPLPIWNTIVAADNGPACSIAGRAYSGDHNLDDDGTCGFSKLGDKPGVNPLLGPLQNNGGPTSTQLPAAGSPAIDAADSPHCIGFDQRGVVRPQLGGCDMGAAEYVPPPPQQSQQTPTETQQQEQPLPPPVANKNVNAIPKGGTVRIKLPGKNQKFRQLVEGEQIPLGTTINTLNGRVTLVAAANKTGKTATADFYDGIVKVLQTKGAHPITRIVLTEKLSCGTAGQASTAAKRKKRRRIWGDGSGRFRTEGEFSSATVRGTKWLTEDRCASTLTRVVRGKVAVRDLVKKKTVIVRAGKRYVAKAG